MALALPLLAGAQEWQTIATSPILVRVREVNGSTAREIWAEGTMDASVQDIQAAILDAEAYPRFMPYVKESRTLGTSPEGGKLNYARIEPPLLSPRDYVVQVKIHRKVNEDGSGEFSNSWRSAPDALPDRDGVVRMRLCEGGWRIRPGEDGHARAEYRAAVDPGGWLPAFLSDMGNRTGVIETFQAVEKEARRRGEQRRAQAANDPRRGQPPSR
jgi:hypothetical protein